MPAALERHRIERCEEDMSRIRLNSIVPDQFVWFNSGATQMRGYGFLNNPAFSDAHFVASQHGTRIGRIWIYRNLNSKEVAVHRVG
jgi:hypothetical protein